MRFLLGVLVGYTVRGKQKLLIRFLVTLALVVYVVLPAIALLALGLDVQRERRSRQAQTKVPVLKGLTYKDAERKLHAANLNIRLLATRYDPAVQPGLIIGQTPQTCTGSCLWLPCWRYHYPNGFRRPWSVNTKPASSRTNLSPAII